MTKLNIDALVDSVLELDLGISKKDAKTIITDIFTEITAVLLKGNSISIPSFGIFKSVIRSARMAINPQTKKRIKIPEKYSVRFSPAKALKESLKDVEIVKIPEDYPKDM
jgi:nucleoid DNA-binding protein